MFRALLQRIHSHVVRSLLQMNITVNIKPAEPVQQLQTNASAIAAQLANTAEYGVGAESSPLTRGDRGGLKNDRRSSADKNQPSKPGRIRAEANPTAEQQSAPTYTEEELAVLPRAERRRIEKLLKKQK